MSRVMRLLAVALCLAAGAAHAQRIQLGGGDKASLKTAVMGNRAEVAPIRIDLELPYVDVQAQRDGFSQLTVPGLVPTVEAGRPQLYTTGALVAVPDGYEPRLEVTARETATAPNVLVAPAQAKYRCDCPQNEGFRFDSALYRSAGIFPAEDVRLEEVGKLQGLRLVRVALYPVRMDFGNRSLALTRKLTATISLEPTGRSSRKVTLTPALHDLVRAATVNASALPSRLVRRASAEVMLVFVADALRASIQDLVDWERAKGLSVEVHTLSEAGGTKESVKQFIQKHYDAAAVKPSYLLFVGNGDSMPPFFESTGSGPAASDYPFSLLSGDDHVPDALYGRIVADNEADVKAQVSRWIAYERTPEKGAPWYAKGLTIASNEGWDPSDKEYAERVAKSLTSNTYSHVDALLQGEYTATEEKISHALSDGRTWLAYFGHGSGTSWGSTNQEFDVAAVDRLTNTGGKLPVLIDVACSNASYTDIDRCFGKAWVTHQVGGENAGAVAFYGGSVIISWHPPAIMSEGIAKYHFEKPVRTLGGSVLAGQLYLIEQEGVNEDTLDNLRWYNLFGDPSLLVRTATPRAYQLTHRMSRRGEDSVLRVTAIDLAGKGVAELRVSVARPGASPVAVGTTDASGTVEMTIPAGATAGATLTVTGYNAETHTRVLAY